MNYSAARTLNTTRTAQAATRREDSLLSVPSPWKFVRTAVVRARGGHAADRYALSALRTLVADYSFTDRHQ